MSKIDVCYAKIGFCTKFIIKYIFLVLASDKEKVGKLICYPDTLGVKLLGLKPIALAYKVLT